MKAHRLTYLALWGVSVAMTHLTHGWTHAAWIGSGVVWFLNYALCVVLDVRGWLKTRAKARA